MLWMLLVYNVLDVATRFSWFGDIDSSEMFHDYKISESLQPYAGVDVSWEENGVHYVCKSEPGWPCA